ncbi:sigma 54-interacting transcriptional regulator [Eubacteriaceae bacterium ES3]|nr:sigma 54-interacting transcriptional regulator [Eubacteriaceae bacterium ES3]
MEEKNMIIWKQLHASSEARKSLPPDLQQDWEDAVSQGLDPYDVRPAKISLEEQKKARKKTNELLVYAETMATALAISDKGDENYCALMFGVDGVLVKIYANEKIESWIKGIGIERWTRWSQAEIGPNVFSNGMRQNGVSVLSGEQCYARFTLDSMWYFSPIKAADGMVFGGLALLCEDKYASPIYTSLLIAVSKGIELNFHWFDMMEHFTDGTEGMGFMTIDQSGKEERIMTVSKEIFTMLKLSYDPYQYHYAKLEHLVDPLPANKEFWSIIQGRKHISDRIVSFSCRGKIAEACISTSKYIAPDIHTDAMVVVFSSLGRIQKLASKQTGSVARYTFQTVIGQDKGFLETVEMAQRAAESNSNILLLGESGTGKDVLSQAIHNQSYRRKGPFVAINCASFSRDLIASELFGYEEGAFTGARRGGSLGKFELANNGTLFLDEIGDMPLDLQAVLLRTLEERSIMRVGGSKMIDVNVRIIAATNKNLQEKIKKGLFREDLFYRLGVVRITIPPLRQRGADVVLLAQQLSKNICQRQGRLPINLTNDAIVFLQEYQWPGNIRELRNLLEGIISTQNSDVINADQIIRFLNFENEDSDSVPTSGYQPEKLRIIEALEANRGNRSKAADAIGMSRSTFYRRLREYELIK